MICLLIIKFESAKLTLSIFSLGNSVKMPDLSGFNTLGTLILNVDVVVLLVATVPPTLIPVTLVVDAKVSVLPSADMPVTSLKTGTDDAPSLNDIIDPV